MFKRSSAGAALAVAALAACTGGGALMFEEMLVCDGCSSVIDEGPRELTLGSLRDQGGRAFERGRRNEWVELKGERKYALRKISAGDYLLRSNDGRTLWRLQHYEDGPSYGLDAWSRDAMFWRTLRWPEPITSSTRLSIRHDVDDLSRWHEIATHLDTRSKAIGAALSHDPGGGAR